MSPARQSWLFDADLRGGHYHVTIRCGPKDEARAKCGDIVVTEDEWPVLKEMLDMGRRTALVSCDLALEIRDDTGVEFYGEKLGEAL